MLSGQFSRSVFAVYRAAGVVRFADRPVLADLPTGRFWPVCGPAGMGRFADTPVLAGFVRFAEPVGFGDFDGLLSGRFWRFWLFAER